MVRGSSKELGESIEIGIVRRTFLAATLLAAACAAFILADRWANAGPRQAALLAAHGFCLLANAAAFAAAWTAPPTARWLRPAGLAVLYWDFAFAFAQIVFVFKSPIAVSLALTGAAGFVVLMGILTRRGSSQVCAAGLLALAYVLFAFRSFPEWMDAYHWTQLYLLRFKLWTGLVVAILLGAVLLYGFHFRTLLRHFKRLSLLDPESGLPNARGLGLALSEVLGDSLGATRVALFGIRIQGISEGAHSLDHDVFDRWFAAMLGDFSRVLDEWHRRHPSLRFLSEPRVFRCETALFFMPVELSVEGPGPAELAESLGGLVARVVRSRRAEAELRFLGAYSVYPEDASSAERLYSNVHLLLHHAEEECSGAFAPFSVDLHAAHRRRESIRRAMLDPLLVGKLRPVFQPKIRLDSGRCAGYEILVRWTHPELGPVSPAEFIPIAEETHAIEAITDFTVREACAFVARILDGEPDAELRVSFNLSPRLVSPRYLGDLLSFLSGRRETPYLEVEITEGVLLRESTAVRPLFLELRALGVHFSIDDFGTGYSNLSYLQEFKADAIKIDRRFVQGVPGHADNANLIRVMLMLADMFGIRTVVEGVENEAQLGFLSELGCGAIQGYYFSRPLAPEDAYAFYLRGGAGGLPSAEPGA